MKPASITIAFIGEDIESRIVFKNAMMQLDRNIAMDFFFDVATACRSVVKRIEGQTGFVFLNAGDDKNKFLLDMVTVKNCLYLGDSKLVIYDTHSILPNTNAIFALGAYAFVDKPYDFQPLVKIVGEITREDKNKTRSRSHFLNETAAAWQYL